MLLIINENRIYELIYDYINDYFEGNEFGIDEYEDFEHGENPGAFKFYIEEDDNDREIFFYYTEQYWSDEGDFRKGLSPMLFIVDDEFLNTLNGMFQDKWTPILKQWFEDKFGKPVKTIDYY